MYTKFEDSGSHRRQDFYDGNFYWREREILTNKGNDKQEEADSLLHNTRRHTKTETIHPLYTSYAGGIIEIDAIDIHSYMHY